MVDAIVGALGHLGKRVLAGLLQIMDRIAKCCEVQTSGEA